MKPFLALFLIGLSAATCRGEASVLRCQDVFDPSGGKSFIWARNAEVNADLKNSPNQAAVEKSLRQILENESQLTRSYPLFGGRELILEKGFNGPLSLSVRQGRKIREIFSTASFSPKNSLSAQKVEVAPDGRTVAIVFGEAGTSDSYHLFVLDSVSGQIRANFEIGTYATSIRWISAHELAMYYRNPETKEDRPVLFDIDKYELNKLKAYRTGTGDWTILQTKSGEMKIVSRKGESLPIFLEDPGSLNDIIGVTDQFIVLSMDGPNELGQIVKIPRAGARPAKPIVMRDEDRLLTGDFAMKDGYVIAEVRWGARRWLDVVGLDSNVSTEIEVPECCSISPSSLTWQIPGQRFEVSLESAVQTKTVSYDLKKRTWNPRNFAAEVMSADGISYQTEVVEVEARDGVKIPMRLTYRAGLKKNGRQPVLFEQYGGFDEIGSIDPSPDAATQLFMKNGGIYAAPALRGGGEFGPDWHQQGQVRNKQNSTNDLIDCARWMAKEKWTDSRHIAVTGTSNGGLIAASAGLQAPDAFGLILPVSGIYDLVHAKELDPLFFESNWRDEYGNPLNTRDRSVMNRISPVKLATQTENRPEFFILAGSNDSRVNPEHAVRLAQALFENERDASPVRLLTLKNAGHSTQSPSHQNPQIALRAGVAFWTKIYDFMGMTFHE